VKSLDSSLIEAEAALTAIVDEYRDKLIAKLETRGTPDDELELELELFDLQAEKRIAAALAHIRAEITRITVH
jgi:hypothetical protein